MKPVTPSSIRNRAKFPSNEPQNLRADVTS